MKPIESTMTTNGSTFKPGDSSVYSSALKSVSVYPENIALLRESLCIVNVLNIVLLLPPAPAALVLAGRAFATLSARSAAAFRLIAVAGPPGALGEAGRAVVDPVEGELIGEDGRGED